MKRFLFFVSFVSLSCINLQTGERSSVEDTLFSFDQNLEIEQINGSVGKLHDIIKKESLVLRVSQTHCKSCVKSIFRALTESNYPLIEHVLVLVDYYDKKFVLFNFPENDKLISHTYQVNSDALKDLPFESSDSPYFFVIDHNFNIKDIHILDKRDAQANVSFLNTVGEKLLY